MTTDSTAALAAALAKVQAKLPKLERDRTVTVEPKDPKKAPYSYSYVTLANLSDAILPLLAEHGLSFATMPGAGSDGKMCLRYYLLHDSGERLSGEFPISGEGGIQMIGGRITYARRYCLAALVGVAADEDDESRLVDEGTRGTARRAQTGQARQQPAGEGRTAQRARAGGGQPPLPGDDPGERQRKRMFALLREADLSDRDAALKYISEALDRQVESTKDLTADEVSTVVERLAAYVAQSEPETATPGGEGR